MINAYVAEKFYTPLSEKFTFIGKGYFFYSFIFIFLLLLIIILIFRKKLTKLKLYNKIKKVLMGFWDGLKSLTRIKRPFLFILYTVAIWLCYLMTVYFCFLSLASTSHLGIEPAFSVLVLGTIGIMLVQGGIGIYPVIVAETLALYGVVSTTAYALGWIVWSAQTFIIIIAGIISLIVLPVINNKVNGKA